MVNSLTRKAGLKLGPIILETLVKHYFERIAKDHESQESTRLRREELLYDEAFNIIRVRLDRLRMRVIPRVCILRDPTLWTRLNALARRAHEHKSARKLTL